MGVNHHMGAPSPQPEQQEPQAESSASPFPSYSFNILIFYCCLVLRQAYGFAFVFNLTFFLIILFFLWWFEGCYGGSGCCSYAILASLEFWTLLVSIFQRLGLKMCTNTVRGSKTLGTLGVNVRLHTVHVQDSESNFQTENHKISRRQSTNGPNLQRYRDS